MLYLTCTTITSVDLAHYVVSHAKDWISVDCGTNLSSHTLAEWLSQCASTSVRDHVISTSVQRVNDVICLLEVPAPP